jgi:osmotically-inducible protein OsmY
MRRTVVVALLIVFVLACAHHTTVTDDQLRTNVRNAISNAFSGSWPGTAFVTVQNHVVTVSGQVRSEEDRRKVDNAINQVRGIRAVINQLSIAP